MTKAELRSWAKKVRATLPIPKLSEQLCQHLSAFLHTKNTQHILLYSAFGSELDPSALTQLYQAHYYIPRVEGQNLHIHALSSSLIKHHYGMSEPSPDSPQVNPHILQAILVPGLVFDTAGFRIGYGKGFYDRFLSEIDSNTLTIGITPEALVIDQASRDDWDIPVQYLATEQGIRPCQ